MLCCGWLSMLIVSAYKTDYTCHVQHCSHPQHNTLHAHQHAQHTATPSPLPSIALLCTQLPNTKPSWQNGTRCRDGVNVLWCRSHLVRLVFESFIPTCACSHSENFFVTCSCCFFFNWFLEIVREKRGG